jgi:acyl-CoA synthetase (AMP-forming)/AMP-acid ligase II
VSPTEVEEAAYATGLVRDVVALGVEDAVLGQRITLVATAANEGVEGDDVLAEIRRRLPLYMVPSSIELRDEIPRSPNGKFDRATLREQLLR